MFFRVGGRARGSWADEEREPGGELISSLRMAPLVDRRHCIVDSCNASAGGRAAYLTRGRAANS